MLTSEEVAIRQGAEGGGSPFLGGVIQWRRVGYFFGGVRSTNWPRGVNRGRRVKDVKVAGT